MITCLNKQEEQKMKKIVLVAIVSLVILSTQSLAWERNKDSREKMKMEFIHKLSLNQEQQKKFLEQRQQTDRDMLTFRQKNEKLRREMRDELKKDRPDRGRLYKFIRETNKNTTEMQIKRMDHMLKMREWLTPEQKVKFNEMCKNGSDKKHYSKKTKRAYGKK